MSDVLEGGSPAERRKFARATARRVLGEGENRLILILAGILCVTVSFVACYLFRVLLFLEMENEYAVLFSGGAVMLAGWIFLAAPVWLGMYRMAVCMICGVPVGLTDLFYYCTSARLYGRAIGSTLRICPCWIPILGGIFIFRFAFAIVWLPVLLLMIVTVLLGAAFSTGFIGFLTRVVAKEEMPLAEAYRGSLGYTVGERMCFLRFSFGTAVRLFLSCLPVGLVFFLQTLPASMLSGAVYSLRLTESRGDFEFFSEKE